LIQSSEDVKRRLLAKRKEVQGLEPTLCWLWTGYKRHGGKGYGEIRISGRKWLTHRAAYYAWRGPVPDGLELDHLCSDKACFNPDHLELVTHQINMARARSSNAEKTHCPKGHPYDFWRKYPDGKLRRGCRRCWTAANRRSLERRI
jgi:hypothetical protein